MKLLRPNVHKNRQGRGFSLKELKAAGLDPQRARNLGIAVDKRRRSAHEENIKVLKYIKNAGG